MLCIEEQPSYSYTTKRVAVRYCLSIYEHIVANNSGQIGVLYIIVLDAIP
jgi:hypothetical protein